MAMLMVRCPHFEWQGLRGQEHLSSHVMMSQHHRMEGDTTVRLPYWRRMIAHFSVWRGQIIKQYISLTPIQSSTSCYKRICTRTWADREGTIIWKAHCVFTSLKPWNFLILNWDVFSHFVCWMTHTSMRFNSINTYWAPTGCLPCILELEVQRQINCIPLSPRSLVYWWQ